MQIAASAGRRGREAAPVRRSRRRRCTAALPRPSTPRASPSLTAAATTEKESPAAALPASRAAMPTACYGCGGLPLHRRARRWTAIAPVATSTSADAPLVSAAFVPTWIFAGAQGDATSPPRPLPPARPLAPVRPLPSVVPAPDLGRISSAPPRPHGIWAASTAFVPLHRGEGRGSWPEPQRVVAGAKGDGRRRRWPELTEMDGAPSLTEMAAARPSADSRGSCWRGRVYGCVTLSCGGPKSWNRCRI